MEDSVMNEKWIPIKGYEGLYEVSSYGRVKSLSHVVYDVNGCKTTYPERILKPSLCHGYQTVVLSKNLKHKKFSVHRLVAFAFIPNPLNLPVINHKDENKGNNNINNLEWCSSLYNNMYGTGQTRKGKKLRKPVAQYSIDGKFMRVYESAREAALINGFHDAAIKNCCCGRQHSSYGYIWKDVTEEEYRKKQGDGCVWIARDNDGQLWIFNEKPIKTEKTFVVKNEGLGQKISDSFFPYLTWDNSPKELMIKVY